MAADSFSGVASKIAEYAAVPVARHVGYVLLSEGYVKDLEDGAHDLDDARQETQHVIEEVQSMEESRIEPKVLRWCADAEELLTLAEKLISHRKNATRCVGWVANPRTRYRLGRKAKHALQDIQAHLLKRSFERISYRPSSSERGRMQISPNTIERCCASNFPPQASEVDELEARNLYRIVHYVNCERDGGPRLPEIVYRSSTREEDIRHHVFRIGLRDYRDIFQNGLRAWPQGSTTNEVYFNLVDHVNHAGGPLVPQRATPRGFVSTTLSPSLATGYTNPVGTVVYRYEIYAPGGIFTNPTLGDRNNFPGQQEITFVAGIAPQYIRAVQLFTITGYNNQGYARLERADPVDPSVVLNINFRLPQSDPERPLMIVNPTSYYMNRENQREQLKIVIYRGAHNSRREKCEVATSSAIENWYMYDVANCESYIDAAFRSSHTNKAYVFMRNEYILLDYAPGTTDDRVVNGPLLICEGFPSLADTPFGEYGIDCAFGSHCGNEAFIFCENLCAVVNYAPGTTDDWIVKGPMTIASMFPFFKGTVFEKGVDAAFESSSESEAYLFRDDQYALINYGSRAHLIGTRPISQGFPSLSNTIFRDGIDAAFASHRSNQAYIFKGRSYARINFAPGTTNDYAIGGVKEIIPNWPSLRSILPRKNRGRDVHNHIKPGGRKSGREEL